MGKEGFKYVRVWIGACPHYVEILITWAYLSKSISLKDLSENSGFRVAQLVGEVISATHGARLRLWEDLWIEHHYGIPLGVHARGPHDIGGLVVGPGAWECDPGLAELLVSVRTRLLLGVPLSRQTLPRLGVLGVELLYVRVYLGESLRDCGLLTVIKHHWPTQLFYWLLRNQIFTGHALLRIRTELQCQCERCRCGCRLQTRLSAKSKIYWSL